MRITITDVSLDTMQEALRENGFGMHLSEGPHGTVAAIDVWSDFQDGMCCGYQVGKITSLLGSFPSYQMVMDSGWCRAERMLPLMTAVITKGR